MRKTLREKVAGMKKKHDLVFREIKATMKEALIIDKDNLDVELVGQPQLLQSAGECSAKATSLKDGAKLTLDTTMAEADTRVREKMEFEDERITEPKVEKAVLIDDKVQAARKAYIKAKQWEAELSSLKDAFTSRGFVLRDLVQLWTASFYSDSSVNAGDVRKVKERLADKAGRVRSKGRVQ